VDVEKKVLVSLFCGSTVIKWKIVVKNQEASKKSILGIMPPRTPNLPSPSGAMQLDM